VGDVVADFRLLVELGRGAHGRVFVATQTKLAERPVVLKITALDDAQVDGGIGLGGAGGGGGTPEHLSLARLQHTNIVPLYSVTDDLSRGVRVLCMPYFGRATIASLIERLADVPLVERTGRHVLDVIDGMQEAMPKSVSQSHAAVPAGAARQMLGHVSYVQAICWIGACIADALQFAHERGLVHLDLKPSNVLLASDGQPMLLDFHLAREPLRAQGAITEHLGGTVPYMPPEQHAAMRALMSARVIEAPVDQRADIYALGAILHETLCGQTPSQDDEVARQPLAQLNPHVSVGLSDIIAKCLAQSANERYAEARMLADDLRRHVTDQPLVGVPNRNLAERWHKWRRRRPGTLRTIVMLLVATAAALILVVSIGAAARYRRQLHEQEVAAQRILVSRELHSVAETARTLSISDAIPPAQLRALSSQCEALWQARATVRDAIKDPAVPEDLQDIAIFAANLQAATSPENAARILDEIDATFGPSAIVAYQRDNLAKTNPTLHIVATPGSPIPLAMTARDHCALGRSYLSGGDLARASQELKTALALDPAGRWANFYYGTCAYRSAHYDEAVSAFSVCIGADPRVAGFFYNRALAEAALGRSEQALRDYDRALQLDPAHADAALNRGVLHFKLSNRQRAADDLNLALSLGADPATVHYDLALVERARQNPAAAREQVRLALHANPAHRPARELQAILDKSNSQQ
jgi:serine/threonine protein kinase/tetratricopeptide (TPR) repeat protein